MRKSDWFLFMVVCFLFGIVFAEYFNADSFSKAFIVLLMWIFVLRVFSRVYGVLIVKLFLFGVFFTAFGFFRFQYALWDVGGISDFNGWHEFEGCIVEEVDVRAGETKYVVEASKINVDGTWIDTGGRVLVNGNKYPIYEFGDCLKIYGSLRRPEKIDDFEYDKYLSRYSIYTVLYKASIEKISGGEGELFYDVIFRLKGMFEAKLNSIFAEPYGGFMAGLILGSRKGIPAELMGKFNKTGLTHIIAVSGYNVTLVIVVVGGLFSFFSRRIRVVLSIFFIFLFVVMVGASASVVRAGIMGVISLMALYFGREYFVFLSLFASAFFMNLWNPKILVYDVGFQLSFLATFGIVLFSETLGKYLSWVPRTLGLREALQLTLSAQITVVPVIILNFERFSFISPIANLFVLPFIPFAMFFGFVSVFFGEILGFFGYVTLRIIIFFVDVFASMDFASLELKWTWEIGAVYYFLLAKFCILKFCLYSSSSE